MAKPKFTLTADLINVEPEVGNEVQDLSRLDSQKRSSQKKTIKYERLNLNIPKDLKKNFQLWCIQKDFNMTQALETAIKKLMDN